MAEITIDPTKVGDVVDLLADILAEFGHQEQILLSTDRVQEMYDILNGSVTEDEPSVRPYGRNTSPFSVGNDDITGQVGSK